MASIATATSPSISVPGTKNTGVVAVVLLFAVIFLVRAAAQAFEIIQFTDYAGTSFRVGAPAIDGRHIVWSASPTDKDAVPNFYLYDFVSGATKPITSYSGVNFRLSPPFLADGYFAWYSNPTSRFELPNYFVYEISTGETTKITNYSGSNGRWSYPATDQGMVAWYADPVSESELPNYFVYDAATGDATKITNYSGIKAVAGSFSAPEIADGIIVWFANPTDNSELPNYFVYDMTSGVTEQITNYSGSSGYLSEPAIADGVVTWYANPTASRDLPNYFIYDIGTKETTQITRYSGSQGKWGDPVIAEGRVAWYANPSSGQDLPNYFVYDIATRETTQVTDYSGVSGTWSLPVIQDGKLVWYASPANLADVPNFFSYDLRNKVTTQITEYAGRNGTWSDPDTANANVVWYASPTSFNDVPNYFLALFNSPPTDILLSNASIEENRSPASPVGQFSTIDVDENDLAIFRLVGGEGDTDNDSFFTFAGTLFAKEAFDAETKTDYSIRVRAIDSAGHTIEKSFEIEIIDTDEEEFEILFVYLDPEAGAAVRWTAEVGYSYQLRYSNSLTGESWTDIGPKIQANLGQKTMTFTDDTVGANPVRYYSVERKRLQ